MGEEKKTNAGEVATTYMYMFTWIGLSGAVIMANKYILDPKLGNFPYPLTLTSTHMLFGTLFSWACVKAGLVAPVTMPWDTYVKSVLPVGGLFAVVLWGGNAAYMYLSVSFIQMLKALMPMCVYMAGCAFGTEKPELRLALNLSVVVAGVLLASWAEVVFVVVGVVLQLGANVAEACRLSLVQILLQSKGIKLNPVQTLCYVAPACLGFMILPCLILEGPKVLAATGTTKVGPGLLLASAAAAFALNCSVFLLVGKTSALTMNIAGIIKDLMLIALSVFLYGSVVTGMQMVGYLIALGGVAYYNYHKIIAASNKAAAALPRAQSDSVPDKKNKSDQGWGSRSESDDEKQSLIKAGSGKQGEEV